MLIMRSKNNISFSRIYQYFRYIVQNQYPDADEYVWIRDLEYYGSFFDEVGISKKVSDLIDVDLTAPSDGQALIYDASIANGNYGNAALNFALILLKVRILIFCKSYWCLETFWCT